MAMTSIAAATRIRKRFFMSCKLLSRPDEQETLQRRNGLSQSLVLAELVVELRRDAQHALRPLRPRLHRNLDPVAVKELVVQRIAERRRRLRRVGQREGGHRAEHLVRRGMIE